MIPRASSRVCARLLTFTRPAAGARPRRTGPSSARPRPGRLRAPGCSSGLMVVSPPETLGRTLSPSSAAFRIWAGLTPSWVSSDADDLLVGVQQGRQQVHRLEPLVSALARQRLGLLHGFLALQGQLIESKGHDVVTWSAWASSTSYGSETGTCDFAIGDAACPDGSRSRRDRDCGPVRTVGNAALPAAHFFSSNSTSMTSSGFAAGAAVGRAVGRGPARARARHRRRPAGPGGRRRGARPSPGWPAGARRSPA